MIYIPSVVIIEPSVWMLVSGVLASIVVAQYFVWKDEHKKGQDAANARKSEIFGHDVSQNFPTLIRLTYKFICHECGGYELQTFIGNQLALPEHPGDGWEEKELGVWLCPKHRIVAKVEEKEFAE